MTIAPLGVVSSLSTPSGPTSPPPRRWVGLATAAVLCCLFVVVRPPSVDFASGDFRVRLFRQGAYTWNNMWFAGHPLPGYGVVSPMLGAWFGVVPVGIISALVGTWCCTLALEHLRSRTSNLADPTVSHVLIASACCVNLWAGRLTFGPSVALGAACVLALQRRRPIAACLLGAACGLASPVGAVSLGILIAGCWTARSFARSTLAAVGIATIAPIGLLSAGYTEGGWFPFSGRSLIELLAALAVAGWLGRRIAVLRHVCGIYAVVAVVAFAVRSPLGGNALRLGWLVAGPVVAVLVGRHRRIVVPLVVAVSLVWVWSPAALAFQPTDAGATPAFYTPLASYVQSLSGGAHRLEVVPTASMRQADELALVVPLARGWLAQLDRRYNPVLFRNTLSASEYHG